MKLSHVLCSMYMLKMWKYDVIKTAKMIENMKEWRMKKHECYTSNNSNKNILEIETCWSMKLYNSDLVEYNK